MLKYLTQKQAPLVLECFEVFHNHNSFLPYSQGDAAPELAACALEAEAGGV
jgi:hypothetical protein